MTRRLRNTLVLTGKILVAGALLTYVLGKVRWFDYVVTADGQQRRVLQLRPEAGVPLEVRIEADGGGVWVDARRLRPVWLRTRDGRTVIVMEARPDWTNPRAYRVQLPDGSRQWMKVADFLPGRRRVVHRGFARTLASARPVLLAGSVLLFLLPVFVLAVRWWYLLRILELRIPLWEAVRLTFLGTFFNYVVPGMVSGDLVKAYYLSRHVPRKAAVLVSVFVDRVVGLLQFAVLPAAVMAGMLLAGAGPTQRLALPAAMVAVVLLGVVVSLALVLSPRARSALGVDRLLSRLPIQGHLEVMAEAGHLYRRRLGGLLKALGITSGGQAAFITAIMLAGMSLSVPLPWYQYFLYVPLIYIIAAVPISPGGLGLTETFYVAFFVPAGAAASEVLALALVARLIPMLCSLPGLVVALTGAKLPPREQIRAEMTIPPT